MKNLKLLNRKYLSIILIFLLITIGAKSEEDPVDIWNLEEKKSSELNTGVENQEGNGIVKNKIYEMQSKKKMN